LGLRVFSGLGVLLGLGVLVSAGTGVEGGCGVSVGTGLDVPVAGGTGVEGATGVEVGIPAVEEGMTVGWGVSVAAAVGSRGVSVGGRLGVRVGNLVGRSVKAATAVDVEEGADCPAPSLAAVGGKKPGGRGKLVAVTGREGTALSVTSGATVAVSAPVTGREKGAAGLGIQSAAICRASAMAVLFMLAKDRSCVLRACRSRAVGGAVSTLAAIHTSQAMLVQSSSAARL
jgi:hypothetical protein